MRAALRAWSLLVRCKNCSRIAYAGTAVALVAGYTPATMLAMLAEYEAIPAPKPPMPDVARSTVVSGLRTILRRHRLINTATGAHDNMAIAAFARHVVRLPAGGYSTTQFDMTDDERAALVDAGRQTMRTFLTSQTVLEGMHQIGGGDFAPTAESTRMANNAAGTILQR